MTTMQERGYDGSTADTKEPILRTLDEAARIMRLSRNSVYRLIREKQLRSVMILGRRLIPDDAIRELIIANTV